MSYVTAFNYGAIVGSIFATGTEGYIAARRGIFLINKKEMFCNFCGSVLIGGCVGLLINTGVQAVIKFTACLIPKETNPQCTSSDYVKITCLALPCIFAASYLGFSLCVIRQAQNYAPIPRDEGEPEAGPPGEV